MEALHLRQTVRFFGVKRSCERRLPVREFDCFRLGTAMTASTNSLFKYVPRCLLSEHLFQFFEPCVYSERFTASRLTAPFGEVPQGSSIGRNRSNDFRS